jgi:cytochrome c553
MHAWPLLLMLSAAAEVPVAPAKLGLCVACHGADGRSRSAAAPHIGGQNEVYLVWALTQYREGRREGDIMSSVAGTLSPSDIEALAAWYARQTWPGAVAPATD